jgi:DNA-binding MarR family transcriptional regulator
LSVVSRAEALEAINDLLASATIFATSSSGLVAAELEKVAGSRVTFTQLKLLRLVDRQSRLTVGDVAAFLGISNAAASKAVERLVRGGLLSRAESPDDRRATEVSMTPEGHEMIQELETRTSATLLKLLAGADVRRLRDLSGHLDRLSVSLSADSGDEARACFRCGLYFREDCLLRTLTNRQCYLYLGAPRSGGGTRRGSTRSRVGATTGGSV